MDWTLDHYVFLILFACMILTALVECISQCIPDIHIGFGDTCKKAEKQEKALRSYEIENTFLRNRLKKMQEIADLCAVNKVMYCSCIANVKPYQLTKGIVKICPHSTHFSAKRILEQNWNALYVLPKNGSDVWAIVSFDSKVHLCIPAIFKNVNFYQEDNDAVVHTLHYWCERNFREI